jgi:mRNA-degrading endonuclease RelE of RelBE toxin-antitoxin system
MEIRFTARFKKQFSKLPPPMKDLAKKQLGFLLSDPQHPSLNLKKMQDPRDIWEGRITKSYRFTFQIQGGTYVLRNVGTHDILRKP